MINVTTKHSLTISLSSLLFSANILAADLKVPDNILVTKVNGQTTSFGLIQKETKVSIRDGRNVIVLRYRDSFEDYDNDDFTHVKSDPHVLIFNASDNQNYQIKKVNFDDEDQAEKFAKNFAVTLLDVDGNQVAATLTTEHNYLSRIDAYVAQAEKSQAVVETKQPKKSGSANQSAAQRAAAVTPVIEDNTQIINGSENLADEQTKNPHTLNMLQYWWSQATEAEKKAFKQHIE